MTIRFRDYLNEQLKDDKFRMEYETVEFEYSLSQAVRVARQSEGLTQKELAKKADIKPSDLKGIEDCQVVPSLDTLQSLARGMGLKVMLEFLPE